MSLSMPGGSASTTAGYPPRRPTLEVHVPIVPEALVSQ